MCTIVALLSPIQDVEVAFFENRDRPLEGFKGQEVALLPHEVVGLYDYRSGGIACGYSLKSHTFGGVANAVGHKGKLSRGVLLAKVLCQASSRAEALEIMREELKTGNYGSATYLLGDLDGLLRIESLGRRLLIREEGERAIATNTFLYLRRPSQRSVSLVRMRRVEEELSRGFSVEAFLKLPQLHDDGATCRHGRTLGSFLALKDREGVRLYYAQGPPCKGLVEIRAEDLPRKGV